MSKFEANYDLQLFESFKVLKILKILKKRSVSHENHW